MSYISHDQLESQQAYEQPRVILRCKECGDEIDSGEYCEVHEEEITEEIEDNINKHREYKLTEDE